MLWVISNRQPHSVRKRNAAAKCRLNGSNIIRRAETVRRAAAVLRRADRRLTLMDEGHDVKMEDLGGGRRENRFNLLM